MKKIIFLFALMGTALLNAQEMTPLYPRDSNLFYQWWNEEMLADSNCIELSFDMCQAVTYGMHLRWKLPISEDPLGVITCAEVAQCMHTDTTLNILGIRVCNILFDHPSITVFDLMLGDDDSESPVPKKFDVTVYAKEGDNMIPLAKRHLFRGAPRGTDTMMVDLYRNFDHRHSSSSRPNPCEEPLRHIAVKLPYKEFFFDEPVTVNDSFYIGLDIDPREVHIRSEFSYPTFFNKWDDTCDHNKPDLFPIQHFRYRPVFKRTPRPTDTTAYYMDWRDTDMHCYIAVFPIVKYGTPFSLCTPVEGLSMDRQKDSTFFFVWSDSALSHLGWEFTYVPDGHSPDEGEVVACDSNAACVTVERGTTYRAFVRPRCVAGRYGEWGTGVTFGHGTQSTGIRDVAGNVELLPNPTTGTVVVRSAIELKAVEVFDTKGTQVLAAPASGRTAQVDLATLPDGVYQLKIHTLGGTAIKQAVKTSR